MRTKRFACIVTIAALLVSASPITLFANEEVSIKIGRSSYNITAEQFRTVKSQEGVHFFRELPKIVPSPLIAVTVPAEFGGGYLIGTSENIAKAFNAAGITLGLTPSAVSEKTKIIGGVAIVTFAGLIIAALGESSTTSKH